MNILGQKNPGEKKLVTLKGIQEHDRVAIKIDLDGGKSGIQYKNQFYPVLSYDKSKLISTNNHLRFCIGYLYGATTTFKLIDMY